MEKKELRPIDIIFIDYRHFSHLIERLSILNKWRCKTNIRIYDFINYLIGIFY